MTHQADPPDQANATRFSAFIADEQFEFRELNFDRQVVESDEVLRKAGLLPTLDHRLVELTFPGTRSRDDDETIDVGRHDPVYLVAGKLDGLKDIAIDEVVYELPFEKLSEPALRKIARIPDDKILVLEKSHSPDQPLGSDSVVSFLGRETERFYTQDATVTVCVDGEREQEIQRGSYLLSKLIALLGIPAGYALSYVNALGKLVQVKPGETVEIFDGIKVFATPACGGAS
ncbi:MAG: hypothetical protein AAF681_03580 [Pseudomonadota bacterium]